MSDAHSIEHSISEDESSSGGPLGDNTSKSSTGTYATSSRAEMQQSLEEDAKIKQNSRACVYTFLLVVAIGGSLLVLAFLNQEEQISLGQQVRADYF